MKKEEEKTNTRNDEKGRNSGRGNEKIANKKKWKYKEGELIIWRRCAEVQYSSWKIQNQQGQI